MQFLKKLFGGREKSGSPDEDQHSEEKKPTKEAHISSEDTRVDRLHNILMGFNALQQTQSLWDKAEQEAFNLPRQERGDDIVAAVKREVEKNLDSVAKRHPAGIPFFTSCNQPIALVRIEGTQDELIRMKTAAQNGKVILLPQVALYSTYSVLSLAILIYDSPTKPFTAEGFVDISVGDVQEFLLKFMGSGVGEIRLYSGVEATPIATGKFQLFIPTPSFFSPDMVSFPVEPKENDLDELISIIETAIEHLQKILVPRRNLKIAVDTYLSETYG